MEQPLILLAEDEPLIALNLQEGLEESGFAVHRVSTGEAAIAALETGDVEAHGLITDVQLGGAVDGWAVARYARELKAHFPVVYMSGDSAHVHTINGVPGSLMIPKPFAPVQVITAISTLMNAVPPSPE